MTDIGNELLAWWSAELSPPLSSALSLREIYLTDLTAADGASLTIPAPAPAPVGGSGDPSLPGNCALCVSFRTDFRGRTRRGRNYVPGLPETQVNISTVTPAVAASIAAAYNGIKARATTAGVTWVVVSRYLNKAPRAAGIPTPVTAVVLTDTTIDSQRRRLPGRGT